MRNLHTNEQSGLILPQVLDDKGEQYFKFELMSMTGQKSYDVSGVIKRYEKDIITALMASQMMLGGENGGSFSLAESLSNISEMAIESKLLEIQEQLNHDMLRQIFELNGMRTDVMPEIRFGSVDKTDLDVLSKFIQRVGAVGMLADTPETINWIAQQAKMPKPFDDTSIDQETAREALVGFTSNAGEGMTSGMGNGTGSSTGSSGDSSTSNGENT
jgi:phage gp29-like protein